MQSTPIEDDGALVAMRCWDGWVGRNASQVGNDSPNDPPPLSINDTAIVVVRQHRKMPRLVVGITSGVSITSRRSPTHTATPTRSRVTTININISIESTDKPQPYHTNASRECIVRQQPFPTIACRLRPRPRYGAGRRGAAGGLVGEGQRGAGRQASGVGIILLAAHHYT